MGLGRMLTAQDQLENWQRLPKQQRGRSKKVKLRLTLAETVEHEHHFGCMADRPITST